MNCSMEEYVRVAAPHLHQGLVSPGELARIVEIARLLPPVSTIFECRLGSPAPQVDFLLRFTQVDGSRELLVEHLERVASAGERHHQPYWEALRGFCQAWTEPGSLLDREVEAVWLELDLFGTRSRMPAPCFFFDLADAAREREAVVDSILSHLYAIPLPGVARDRIARSLALLPPGGRLFSVGIMFNRAGDTIRLCLSHLSADQLAPYLDAIGWTDPGGELGALIDRLAPHADAVALAVDVGERVAPTVGVEFHIEGEAARRKLHWARFLQRLVDEGRCVPEKAEGVVGWLGQQHARSTAEGWPRNLLALADAAGPQVLSTFVRQVSHVKVVYEPGRPPQAKAYLELLHRWFRFDPARRRFVLSETLDSVPA